MEPAERTQILFNLSLARSSFRTALLPRLFNQLVLYAHLERITPSVSFCLALMDGDAHARSLAVHIRTCKIFSWSSRKLGPSKSVAMPAAMRCYQALPWMPNIGRLVLFSSDICREFWKVVSSLPMLKTLEICGVSFRGNIPAEDIDRIAGLQVLSLRIPKSRVFSSAVLPQPLSLTALSKLSCDLDTLDKLLARGSISALGTLTIYSSSVGMRSLTRILSQVPSVHNFTIYSKSFVEESPGAMPRDFPLPNLRSLACYHPFLAFLTPNRPLVNLNVLDEDSSPLNLSAILGSYGPSATGFSITHLYIPSTIHLTPGHFPCLHKLVVTFPPAYRNLLGSPGPGTTTELMELIVDTCDKWAVNSSLQRLRIAVETRFNPMDLDLVMQYTVLSGSLLQKFPALRCFQLGYRVKWERFVVDEAWRVFVPNKYRMEIVADVEDGGPSVVDYDGYLQQLSTNDLP